MHQYNFNNFFASPYSIPTLFDALFSLMQKAQ